MKINSQLTKEDYVKINYSLLRNRTMTRIVMAFYAILLVLGILLALGGLLSALIIPILGATLTFWYYWWLVQKTANSKDNSKMFLPTSFEFNENGVKASNEIGKEECSWAAFVKYKKIAGHYLLFINSSNFYAIKESAIPDQESFETMLKEKIKTP